jgi:chromosome segregation ATPase
VIKVSKLRDKLKDVVGSITDALSSSSSAIEEVIKENKQYLDSILNVVKESEEGINALKKFAETEAPSLKAAISTLASTYESLEAARKEKTAKLRANFITPLEELLVSYKKRQEELKDVEAAEKELEKAQKKYDKENSKPDEKKDTVKLATAKELYEKAKKELQVQQKEADIANKKFETEKLETLKKIINNIVTVERNFHESMLKKIKELEQKASAIGVKKTTTPSQPEKPTGNV